MIVHIYYYTPLPLNLASNKQASKQQASNTSPFRVGHCSLPPLRALLYSSHLIPSVVALRNPSFEPKTPCWCPGVGVPRWEVPSQNHAFCARKTAIFGPKRPRNSVKMTKQGKRLLHSTCAMIAP